MKQPKHSTDLCEAIRRAIADSGLNRFQLAKRANLPYAIVHNFVGGKRGMTMDSVSKILAALGLIIDLRPVRRARQSKTQGGGQ